MINRWILTFGWLVCLTGCGEPVPVTETRGDWASGIQLTQSPMTFSFDGSTDSTLNLGHLAREVFGAEFEETPWTFSETGQSGLAVTLVDYEFEREDDNGWCPGWLLPGVIPFGPMGIWLYRKDNRISTPSLFMSVDITCGGKSMTASTRVVRGVTREEDLVRVGFSELARQARQWIRDGS